MSSCSRCPEPAITSIAYSGQDLCRQHFLRFFDERAKRAISEQGKLPKGKLAVALSGGKDSVSVLHFLHGMTKGRPDVELVAITIDEGIAGYRDSAIDICRDLTERLGIPWHLVKTKDLAGYTIDEYAAGDKGPSPDAEAALRIRRTGEGERPACGPCGIFRRLGMNQVARELGAAAIVTGHNLDDTAQTILMNVLGGDPARMARLAPHDREDAKPGMVPRMLPFRSIPEKEILLYCMLNDLPLHLDEECPYAARANRFAIRDVLWKLETDQPGTRHRLLKFQDAVKPILVAADEHPAGDMATCSSCGEPTSGSVCKSCQWRAQPADGRRAKRA